MNNEKNHYVELASINVNEHVEQKGKFKYLSWTWAVDQLRRHDPSATWEVIRFDGLPFLKSELGYFVEVAVTVNGITLSQIHPVLNNYNKPIAQPTSFDINTSIQRCLVKAIALHGLGIYIYAGEDLPMVEEANDLQAIANQSKENVEQVEEQKVEDPKKSGIQKALTKQQKDQIEQKMGEILEIKKDGTKQGLTASLRQKVGPFKTLDKMTQDQAVKSLELLKYWKEHYEKTEQ